MNNACKIFTLLIMALLYIAIAGCSYIAPQEPEELVPLKTIGVLPVQTPASQQTGATLEKGADTLNGLLAGYFMNNPNTRMISQAEVESIATAQVGDSLYLAREAGKQLGYDAVLVTSLYRFEARKGTELAADTPASVAFSLKLLAVGSGQVVWNGDFDQTQQTLLENILPKTRSIGAGFRWLTAEELAAKGLNKELDQSPYLKKN